jgi:hypothetical protein
MTHGLKVEPRAIRVRIVPEGMPDTMGAAKVALSATEGLDRYEQWRPTLLLSAIKLLGEKGFALAG